MQNKSSNSALLLVQSASHFWRIKRLPLGYELFHLLTNKFESLFDCVTKLNFLLTRTYKFHIKVITLASLCPVTMTLHNKSIIQIRFDSIDRKQRHWSTLIFSRFITEELLCTLFSYSPPINRIMLNNSAAVACPLQIVIRSSRALLRRMDRNSSLGHRLHSTTDDR